MNKLTAKLAEKSLPRSKEYKLADGGGLYLRIRPSGAKSWLFLFRLPNARQLHKMTLGSLDEFSLKEVRSKLLELRKLITDGFDPRKVRAAVKAENAEAITMQKLFDNWINFAKLNNNVSQAWGKRHENRWNLHLKDALGMLLIKDINRAHLAAALDIMTKKGIKEETRKALTTFNLMMDYALARNFINQNPARILKPKDFAATANHHKKRVLTLQELHLLWLTLDQALGNSEVANTTTMMITTIIAIKLLILTGARRGEVATMRWSELDLEHKIWRLESTRTKNRQAHTIYLADLVVTLIKHLQPLTSNSVFVFDTGTGSKGHINQDSLTRAITRLRTNTVSNNILSELKPFTIHDLRRSAATGWGEYLKTNPHVIERMLNHQPLNKLVATYQRATYSDEQKVAWTAWGKLIEDQLAKETIKIT